MLKKKSTVMEKNLNGATETNSLYNRGYCLDYLNIEMQFVWRIDIKNTHNYNWGITYCSTVWGSCYFCRFWAQVIFSSLKQDIRKVTSLFFLSFFFSFNWSSSVAPVIPDLLHVIGDEWEKCYFSPQALSMIGKWHGT